MCATIMANARGQVPEWAMVNVIVILVMKAIIVINVQKITSQRIKTITNCCVPNAINPAKVPALLLELSV